MYMFAYMCVHPYVCAYACICLSNCECILCVHKCVHMCMCECACSNSDQSLRKLNHSPPYVLRQALSLNFDLTDSTRLAGHRSPVLAIDLPLSHLPSAGIICVRRCLAFIHGSSR